MKLVVTAASAVFLFFIANIASAGVIGGLNTPNDKELSAKIESIYLNLIANGSIPVKKYLVQPGDTVESVLRREGAVAGPYFPAIVDALTCDLNTNVCHRSLEPAQDRTSDSDITALSTPLMLRATIGDWAGLQPGQEILIPDVLIEGRLSSKVVVKPAGVDADSLLQGNPACSSSELAGEDCQLYFEYLNYGVKDITSFDGPVQVPAIDYAISVRSECVLCAVIRPVGVDFKAQAFTESPYKIYSEDPINWTTALDASPPDLNIKIPTLAPVDSEVALPSDVHSRLEIGNKLVQSNSWLESPGADLFSGEDEPGDPFNPKQNLMLSVENYPSEDRDELLTRLLAGTTSSVMIVDSNFDAKHCDMPEDIVIYDCGPAVDRSKRSCPLASGDFEYNSGQPTMVATTGPAHQSTPQRPLCGPAGEFVLETTQDTDSFRDPRHGTQIAGIIASKWDGFGTGGLNPYAKIIGVEVDMHKLNDPGYGLFLLHALNDIMRTQQVHVVNLSLGFRPKEMANNEQGRGDWLSELIHSHLGSAVFVAAAGNEPDVAGCSIMPACLALDMENVVAVVATDGTGKKVREAANTNPGFTIGADGQDILGPFPLNQYGYFSGSSQSAAIVSGTVSLAYALGQIWPPAATRDRLVACSTISPEFIDKMVGGELDVACFLGGDKDRLVTKSGDIVAGDLVRVDRNSAPQDTLEYYDNDAAREDLVQLADLVGFQTNADSDAVLFKRAGLGKLVRLVGTIPNDQKLFFRLSPTKTRSIAADEAIKFVRGIAN